MRLLSALSGLRAAFFCLGIGSFLGPILGAVTGGLLNQGSQGNPSSGTFTPYSPTGLSTADQGWQSMFSGLMGNVTGNYTGTGATVPMINQGMQDLEGLMYGPNNTLGQYLQNMQGDANQAGGNAQQSAVQANLFSNMMGANATGDASQAASLINAGNQVFNTAMDPNQALYNSGLQQTNQQANAASSMRGIGMSPEAAGLQNQADQTYNLGWQQQQLQNQLAGLQGMNTAYQGAGNYTTAENQGLIQAQQMGGLIPGLQMESGQLPYQTALSNAESPLTMANAISGSETQDVMSPILAMMGSAIPYMNYGTGAQSSAFNAGQTNLGNYMGLGSLGNTALGNMFTNFSNPFSSNSAAANANQPYTGSSSYAGGGDYY